MRLAIPAIALVFLSGSTTGAERHVTEKEGSVFGIIGVWMKDGKPLRFGNAVNVGDKICAERSGSITLSFKDGTASFSCERNSCKEKPPCSRPVAEDDKKIISGFERYYAAVLPIFRREGERLIAAVSRGSDVSEAVVPLKGETVDLSPMLTDAAPGAYGARFRRLWPESLPGPVVKFQHRQGAAALVSVPNVKPGLYQIELFNPDGQALGMDAWVLVSGPDTYGQDSEAFKQANQITSNWSRNTDARSVRAFLRAYLESLAQSQIGR